MKKIKLITDTASDLTLEIAKEYDIHLIPINLNIDGKQLKDKYDISNDEFYNYLETHDDVPKTAQISVGEHIDEFKKFVKRQCDSLKETRSIDVSEYIVFDNITECKVITIQESVSNESSADGTQEQGGTMTLYIVNTSDGWKVVDFNLVYSLQIINEEIWMSNLFGNLEE